MSLSDSCIEISSELALTLAHYAHWDYSVDHLLPLVDAMFDIAAVGAALDVFPNHSKSNLDLVIHHINSQSSKKQSALEALCRVASQSPRLNNAIADFREWIGSPAGKKYQEYMGVSYDDIEPLLYRNNQ